MVGATLGTAVSINTVTQLKSASFVQKAELRHRYDQVTPHIQVLNAAAHY